MALVGEIRNRSGLIVFVVGLGLLLFIIPFDKVATMFATTGEQPIGQINGEDVYSSKYKAYTYSTQNLASQYSGATTEQLMQAEQNNWYQLIQDTLYRTEIGKIGLQSSPEEFSNVMINGNGIPEMFKDAFSFPVPGAQPGPNSEKIFQRDSLLKWYNKQTSDLQVADADGKAQLQRNLSSIQSQAFSERLKTKYNAMVQYGVVASNKEAEKSFKSGNSTLDIQYVFADYSKVSDDKVSVSDKDVKAFFEKQKNNIKWKQEADMRSYQYVSFPVEVSEEDKNSFIAEMNNLKASFGEVLNDTAFIAVNSDATVDNWYRVGMELNPLPGSSFDASASNFPANINTEIDDATAGQVVGPFIQNVEGTNYATLVKVRNATTTSDCEIRQIVIDKGLDAVKAKSFADSLLTVINDNPSSFSLLKTQFSSDKMNATGKGVASANGSSLPEAINSFGLSAQVGAVSVIETENSYNIVEKLTNSISSKMIAICVRKIKASQVTKDLVYQNKGLAFRDAVKKNGFEAAAKEFNVVVEEIENVAVSFPIYGKYGYIQRLAAWSFRSETKNGTISEPFIKEYVSGQSQFQGGPQTKSVDVIVLEVTKVANEGAPTYEGIEKDLRAELIKQEKIAYLNAKVSSAKSLEEVAQIWEADSVSTLGVETSTLIFSDDSFSGKANDPVAVAKAFTLAQSQVSTFEGEEGAYAVIVNSTTIAPVPADLTAAKSKATLEFQNANGSAAFYALYRAANVKDWRVKSKLQSESQNR